MILKTGIVLAALSAVLLGVVLYTSIPTRLGYYRWLAKTEPALIGLTPAYIHGLEWGFTHEQLSRIDLTGQITLVTGGNSGLGYAKALMLARQGAQVTIACRNGGKCKAAALRIKEATGKSVKALSMDTSSMKSVKNAAEEYQNKLGEDKVDMLFLNAGTVFRDPNLDCVPLSEDNIELSFATNYVGHHLLYRLLENNLAPEARVVSTSSAASFTSFPYKVPTDIETLNGCSHPYLHGITNLSYGQSKLAQILWTKALSRHKPNLVVNAYHPGAVDTNIWSRSFEKDPDAPKIFVQIVKWMQKEAMWSSADGALTGMYLGAAIKTSGGYFHPQSQPVTNPDAEDEDLQERLWKFSEELVKDLI